MDEDTTTQFRLIGEIGDALGGAGIPWWLFGGWALDFRLGEITRPHSDIEMFVWEMDATVVRTLLERRGFIAREPVHPDEGQPFLKDGQEVSVTFLIKDHEGRVCTPGRWRAWPWAPGSFDAQRASLGGVTAPAMSLEGQLDMKTRFAAHAHGAPLRQKDMVDIALLRDAIARIPGNAASSG